MAAQTGQYRNAFECPIHPGLKIDLVVDCDEMQCETCGTEMVFDRRVKVHEPFPRIIVDDLLTGEVQKFNGFVIEAREKHDSSD